MRLASRRFDFTDIQAAARIQPKWGRNRVINVAKTVDSRKISSDPHFDIRVSTHVFDGLSYNPAFSMFGLCYLPKHRLDDVCRSESRQRARQACAFPPGVWKMATPHVIDKVTDSHDSNR